ncbi:RNA polymerase sigma factor [Hungatella hathewayi]|uniref:RNA polymerase sigma factor n=1 Tax=Hungatella hathewayi TaxID=154046 RepID=UPI001FA905DF|nr:RNA polymerase sigma factor [Hungatella hathewayi]
MISEEELIFEKIYTDYQCVLRQYARVFMVPVDDIDDIIQETFIEYFRRYKYTWSTTYKKGLLIKILRGKSIDCLRKHGHYKIVSLNDNDSIASLATLPRAIIKDPADFVVSGDATELIIEEIDNMRRDRKEIAILYFLEQRTIPEICRALNITESVCNSRIHRTKVKLRKRLAEYMDQ